MGSIVYNGVEYKGRNISIFDNQVVVDGKVIDDNPSRIVEIKVDGDIGSLRTSATTIIAGNVNGDVDAGNSVKIRGNVTGDVDAGNSVQCHDVYGDIDAGNSVYCNGRKERN